MTLEQILQTAVTHHKSGDLVDAERLYRSILSEQTNHPDANHNLGVLLKQGDKADIALPLFKTALESNPNQGQYWISYIDTLIHLGQYDDAQNVLNQGQAKELKDNAVDQLKERLNLHPEATSKKNPLGPPQTQIDAVISLYSRGQIHEALSASQMLIKDYPNVPLLYNISGACYKALGQLEEAVKSYEQSLAIKPDFADVLIQLGIYLWIDQDLDKLKSYITSKMDLNKCSKKSLKFVNPYLSFLTQLHKHRLAYPHKYLCNNQSPVIHVIGESHCLTAANSNIEFMGKLHTMKSNIIIGCKAWHLANNQLNAYKKQFEKIERSIPNDGMVIVTIGEIDCRLDEGILKFHQKTQNNLGDSIKDLVQKYTKYIIEKLASVRPRGAINLSRLHEI
jgi:tetratricopeptide (TPR) repeat protein